MYRNMAMRDVQPHKVQDKNASYVRVYKRIVLGRSKIKDCNGTKISISNWQNNSVSPLCYG